MKSSKFARVAFAAALAFTLAACGSAQEETSASQTKSKTTTTTETTAEKTSETTEKSKTTAATITEDQAKAAALSHAKVDGDGASFTKVKLDTDDGKQVYDITFVVGDTEYDYEIDAATGDVLSSEQEVVEAVSTTQTTGADQGNYIGEDAALAKALQHAGVAQADLTEREISLDTDETPVRYDVEFHVGTTEYSYEIDATTGDVLDFDAPEVDD